MRTLFDLSARRDAWSPNAGGPLSLGQASIEDILKSVATGAGTAATSYEQAQTAKEQAAAAASQAQAAAAQAKAASAVAAAQNPTILGMTPTTFAIATVGVLGLVGLAIVMGGKKAA
jgi:hypothetical protein